jgi:hypothetical protein
MTMPKWAIGTIRCKYCGCSDDHACHFAGGDRCSWVILFGFPAVNGPMPGLLTNTDFYENICSNPACVEAGYRDACRELSLQTQEVGLSKL